MTEDQFKLCSNIEQAIKTLNDAVAQGHRFGITTDLSLDGPNYVSAKFQFNEKPVKSPTIFE